jgi:hypothetical protein
MIGCAIFEFISRLAASFFCPQSFCHFSSLLAAIADGVPYELQN